MSSNPNSQRRGPPLAGRPPFATDEDDAVYDDAPAARPRRQQQKPPQQGGRDSMYQAWDNYLHTDNKDSRPNSGAGGIGMGLMAGDLDDSDDDDQPPVRKGTGGSPAKSTAPAKSSNLRPSPSEKPRVSNDSPRAQPVARPPPAATAGAPAAHRQGSHDRPPYQQQAPITGGQQQQQQQPMPRQTTGVQRPAAAALRVDVPQPAMPIPRAPIPAFMQSPSPSPSPSFMPHPLNAPSTPITPVFARPSFQGSASDKKVEFSVPEGAILRGNSEETLLPRNTPKGEEFWRRFSFIAKEEPKRKKSKWLRSTMGSSQNMSRFIWCISIFLLLCIGGGIGFGWYMTHNNTPSLPVVVGGGANESQLSTSVRSTVNAAPSNTSRTLIAPTAIETKKRDLPEETPAPSPTPMPASSFARRSHLHARNRLNRLD